MRFPALGALALGLALSLTTAAQAAEDPFAARLYGALRGGSANLIVSPASLADAFALVYPGATGQTAAEIAQVFGFEGPTPRQRFPTTGPDDPVKLKAANALWPAKQYPMRESYLATMRNSYGASITPLDFSGDGEGARNTINTWVAERTEGRIRDLLAQAPDPSTQVVLTNAVYLKARWSSTFDRSDTKDAPFRKADGTRVQAPLMHQTGRYRYLKRPGFSAIEFPYEGEAISMVVLLPDAPNGLARLERSATPNALGGWISALYATHPSHVEVTFPKFRIETRLQLEDTLPALGLRRAFLPGAELRGMADGPLQISAVVQKAFIAVDEDGTEAAAATAIEVVITAAFTPNRIETFRADHPFVFIIRDNASGAILFMGRLETPGPEAN